MRERKKELAKWLALEVGKPLVEGEGEVGGGADIFEWNAEETKRIFGQTVESRFEDTRVQVIFFAFMNIKSAWRNTHLAIISIF